MQDISTRVRTCPFCSKEPTDEFTAREMMFGTRDEFTYCRCGSCESLWLAAVPDDMGRYYDDDYYSLADDSAGVAPSRAGHLWVRLLLALPTRAIGDRAGTRGFPQYLPWFHGMKLNADSRIADVGSGNGKLLRQLARHGFHDLWGYDPFIDGNSDDGAVHLRRGGIDDMTGQFKVVMFNHSLEHMASPVEALTHARDRLAPDGRVLVRIPVAGSYADREYGEHWVGLDPPRHLAIPTPEGMESGARAAGFLVESVFYDSAALQFWGSERYRAGKALYPALGDPSALAALRERARTLNSQARGDTAGFVLRPT